MTWQCLNCETLNQDTEEVCEACGLERFYTKDDIEKIRRTWAKTTLASSTSASSTSTSSTSADLEIPSAPPSTKPAKAFSSTTRSKPARGARTPDTRTWVLVGFFVMLLALGVVAWRVLLPPLGTLGGTQSQTPSANTANSDPTASTESSSAEAAGEPSIEPMTARSIDRARFYINGSAIEDPSQPYPVSDHQVRVHVEVRDTSGLIIPAEKLFCTWDFIPSLEAEPTEHEGSCQMSFQLSGSTAEQTISVQIKGRDSREIQDLLINTFSLVQP